MAIKSTARNENCLSGWECPKCGYRDEFNIEATGLFIVTDDGTDSGGQIEWQDTSYASCANCGHTATVADFTSARCGGCDEFKEDCVCALINSRGV